MLLVEGNRTDKAVVLHLNETPIRKIQLTSPGLVNAALSPDGNWVAASVELGQYVRIWNAHDGGQVCDLPIASDAEIRFSPDSRRIVTNTGPAICIRETGTWKLHHEIKCAGRSCSGIGFTSDSRLVAVGLWGDGIRLIETETGQPIATLETAQRPPAFVDLNFSPDDTLLTAAVDFEGCCVWDIRNSRTFGQVGIGLESAAAAYRRCRQTAAANVR